MMQNSTDPIEEEFWVIWNGTLGIVDTVSLGEIEEHPDGRQAWLDEPYDMVGPFDLEELASNGQIAFAACIVMSRQKWQEQQVELRHQAHAKRRAYQERVNERFGNHNNRHRPQASHDPHTEKQHRESLKLPLEGVLVAAQIKKAYRRMAQKTHPDVGGSHELFVRIKQARDALLASIV